MSIKPIDYINLISKSQEVSKIKQTENEKANLQFQQGIIQQQKHIDTKLKKVQKSNKSEYKIVDKYGDDRESKRDNKDERKSKKNNKRKRNTDIGTEIDIKI